MSYQLRLDATACSGHGLCAGFLPELITMDEWGYPIVLSDHVPDALLPHARRAVGLCPVLALRLAKGRQR